MDDSDRRWCWDCEVSALDEARCWMCGEPTISNVDWFARKASQAVPSDDTTPPGHEGERGEKQHA